MAKSQVSPQVEDEERTIKCVIEFMTLMKQNCNHVQCAELDKLIKYIQEK